MNLEKIDSQLPSWRKEKLKDIERYSMFDVMFYRTDLWTHTHRTAWLVEEILPTAKQVIPQIDINKTLVLALIHDDPEMVTGDVQLGHKILMTEKDKIKLWEEERRAIKDLAGNMPKSIGGYDYKELAMETVGKSSLESKLVSYADKLDAYCESIHELFAGNLSFVRPVILYTGILSNFSSKFPELKPILALKDLPLLDLGKRTSPIAVETKHYAHLNQPHTSETIKIPTEFVFYNRWREITLEKWGKDGVKVLTEQKEFLK